MADRPHADGKSISELKHSNEVLAARLRLLTAYPTHTLKELLIAAVDEAEALTGSAVGFLHHVDEERQALKLQVWSTATKKRFCFAEACESHYPVEKAGVWVDALKARKPVIHNDYASLPHRKGLPKGHAPIVRELVVPVLRGGRVVALLGVGNKAEGYTDEDVETTHLLADLAWDITERKRVEERLALAEERSRLAEAAAGVGVFDWDMARNRCVWSEELYRIYGVAPGSVENPSARWEEWVYPPDLAEAKAHAAECLAARRGRLRGDFRIVRQSDGAVRWLKNDALVFYGEGGEPKRMVGSSLDVTYLKSALDAVRDRELILNEAQRVGSLGIYDYDLTNDHFYASPELEEIFGVGQDYPHDLGGWLALIAPEHRERMLAHFQQAAATNSWFDMEYEIIRARDGERRWVYGTGQFKTGHDGSRRMVGTIQDVTRRKRMEAEEALLKERLSQAQKMESLGTLAGGIAHDFNNILAAIIGYTELTLENPTDVGEIEENLHTVLVAALRARELVRQILAFARKGTGAEQPLRLDDALAEALKLLRQTTPSSIDFKTDHNTPLTVVADPSQIHQVVINLAANACQAMGARGGTLTVTLTRVELTTGHPPPAPELKPGGYALLAFTDDGPGIAPEVLPRVFDPFFTTKAVGEGTGMGLATVHGVVAGAGGAVTVLSRLGAGTTFNVYLPLAATAIETALEKARTAKRGGGRVLVVDDEPSIAVLARKMLTYLGFEPVAHTSPAKAWEEFARQPEAFDAVITDQTMPEMLGIELTLRIKNLRRDTPVIICTGYSDSLTEASCRDAGVAALLNKPVEMKRLAETLAQVLEGRDKAG